MACHPSHSGNPHHGNAMFPAGNSTYSLTLQTGTPPETASPPSNSRNLRSASACFTPAARDVHHVEFLPVAGGAEG